MAHTIDLDVQPREVIGKKVKSLRRAGIIPANLYGHGVASIPLQVSAKALENAIKHATATTVINLKIGRDKRRTVFLREVRYEPVRGEPQHVEFIAVRMNEAMRATVPVVLRGDAPAAKNADLMLFHPVSAVQVQGMPGDLPEAISVDVTGLSEADQVIHARDLHLPDNVQLLDDPDEIIVKVQVVRAAVSEEPTEPAAPAGQAPAEGERTPQE